MQNQYFVRGFIFWKKIVREENLIALVFLAVTAIMENMINTWNNLTLFLAPKLTKMDYFWSRFLIKKKKMIWKQEVNG